MPTTKVYGKAIHTLLNHEWDFETDTIVAALCASSYTPDQDAHDYADDLTDELSGGGYSRVTLTSKSVVYASGTNTYTFDCDDLVFPSLTAADIRYVVFFADTGADSVSPLLLYVDVGYALSITSNAFNVNINASGLMTITVA